MNLNAKQILAIILAVLSVLSGSTAQLTDLLGVTAAKSVISIASLTMSVLSSILAVLSSQGNLVKDVRSMNGVEKLLVNDQANQTLAKLATDPTEPKIGATDAGTRMVLQDTAKGNGA